MTFAQALENLKGGRKVARSGWNGKGMYLFHIAAKHWEYARMPGEPDYPRLPFIAMKTADDKVVPWLASLTDLLADDWENVG